MDNKLHISVLFESGCNPAEGEYGFWVNHILEGAYKPDEDHEDLIEAVSEFVADNPSKLSPDSPLNLIAKRGGERQDVYWVSWYEITTLEQQSDGTDI